MFINVKAGVSFAENIDYIKLDIIEHLIICSLLWDDWTSRFLSNEDIMGL